MFCQVKNLSLKPKYSHQDNIPINGKAEAVTYNPSQDSPLLVKSQHYRHWLVIPWEIKKNVKNKQLHCCSTKSIKLHFLHK